MSVGFSFDIRVNISLFFLFFIIYFITVVGNILIIGLIVINPRLHIPMYFFLCILAFLDLWNSSSVVPKLLINLFSVHRTISVGLCVIQFYGILFLGGTECQLLALMAYDRYIAICHPLHYPVMMRWSVCYQLTAFVWILSFVVCVVPSLSMPMSLCYNEINHFMCEMLAVVKITCGDIGLSELMIFFLSFVSLLLPFIFILISYVCIIYSVLKIKSAGRSKAFSTCTSHITVVGLLFGTGMLMYFGPSSQYSSNREKYVSVFYIIICPMLNPIIYSLNNREVKETFKKLIEK
uniref:Olfactory receptor n=1 Tax=Pyxicephalus adspersus TaxID=30357 RepID=A0AAV3ARS5_PYXAD|nr:TPA: hypothetical protein GDO54_009921 [Pyxicephalus adspersus]